MGGIALEPIKRSSQEQLVRLLPYIFGLLLFTMFPLLVPTYLQTMITKVFVFAIFAMSLNLIWGYTGLTSLGHAAYFGIGGYVYAILVTRYGIESFWVSGPLSILATGLVAAAFGIVALRVTGVYFLLVTLALGRLVYYVAVKWRSMTQGSDGIIGIALPNLGLPGFTWNATYFCFFVLFVLIICYILLYLIVKSPFGYALQGVRDQEPRMRCLGYNTWLYKYIAFIIAGIFAGIAGMLFSQYLGVFHPDHTGVAMSTVVLLMVIIGGTRMFFGPIIGAIVIVLLEYFASLYMPARWPMLLGAVFVIAVMFLRGGIGIHLVRLWEKVINGYGSVKGCVPL
ncbi:MAG: branched-chain amino acid ABC transporter permease [Deltaproteobacteria bacterium]|nr:branched-chain amino acid ABC transporter permease [Deltaproteobacteria bacterium]